MRLLKHKSSTQEQAFSTLLRRFLAAPVVLLLLLLSQAAYAEYALNFQDPVTEVARDIFGLHMLIFYICVAIFVGVF